MKKTCDNNECNEMATYHHISSITGIGWVWCDKHHKNGRCIKEHGGMCTHNPNGWDVKG